MIYPVPDDVKDALNSEDLIFWPCLLWDPEMVNRCTRPKTHSGRHACAHRSVLLEVWT